MKVFISSDIEGSCGINHLDETRHDHPDIRAYMQQMSREVSAAVEGAVAAGAEEVLVKDGHGTARNILPELLPKEALLLRGWTGHPYGMMSGLELGGCDVVFFTGYHSAAGSSGNPLCHTKNGRNEWMKLNGSRLSEFRLNAYTAGMLGIPVCFISGDEAICQEAKELIPGIRSVAAFKGIGGASLARHPELVCEEIRREAQLALEEDLSACQVPMPEHFDFVIRYRDQAQAYKASFYPGCVLEEEKNVRLRSDNYMDILRFLLFAFA